MTTEATCGECGSVYRGKAIDGLTADQWERRDGVLCDLRWCLCQRGRMGRDVVTGNIVLPHPEYGDNVVLVMGGYENSIEPITFDRATRTTYTAKGDVRYHRGAKGFKDGRKMGATGYHIPRIVPSELPRLEAWVAKGGGK